MSRRPISNKALWGVHIGQGRAEEISAWMAANGAASEERVAPLRVEPPVEWPMYALNEAGL